MVRELRLDYGGHSFRWFDTDEMIRVHGSSSLPSFLAQNIEEHFRVPVQFQVLCDLQGPLSTRDFQRVLSGKESPRLWLFDSRYMGEDLRKQFERRQAEAAGTASSDEPTTLWSRKLETLVEETSDRSGNDDDMEKRVAKLSESLEKREEQVAKLLDHHEAQIQELQRELSERTAPPIEANGWEASDSEDESNLQLLEAEEARLLQSVQDALAKITDRTPSTTCEFQETPQGPEVSPSLTCSGDATRSKSSHSGPLPPLLGSGPDTFCQYCGEMREKKEMRESREIEETRRREEEEKRRHQEQLQLEEALATMRKAQEEEKQSQLLLRQWQARAVSAEEALTNQEHAEVAQVKLHGKLEVEVALRNKDLEYAQELRSLNEQNHRSELEHQASVLALRHRNAALLEQEEWQQMEILLLRSQQFQSEKAQEQQVQDLMSSVEWERLGSELRVSQLGKAEHRSKEKTKDLGARLVGRDLEVLALESLMERHVDGQQQHFFAAQQSAGPSEAQKKAEQEAKSLAAELMQKAEMLQQEEAARSMHLAEIAMQGKELVESKCREEQLQQRLVQLEAQLADALAANARPATPKLEPAPAPAKISDYISTADDELDKTLEKEIMDLGPGILKGNVLERTGPKRYKLGDQKVFMQLSEGKVTVRVGGAYIPLLQWTKELTAVGEKGNDDPFSALDAQSPFAAVR